MQDRAVIVGGGSYGGMLAAWLRLKYPQWFQGALAASAPILFFDGYVNPDSYDRIATAVYEGYDPSCSAAIKDGFVVLNSMAEDSSNYQHIADIFQLCKVPETADDVYNLSDILDGNIGSMVMVNYPYASDFLNPLPAWPVAHACGVAEQKIEEHGGPYGPHSFENGLIALQAVNDVFINYEGTSECFDINGSQMEGISQDGWNVLYCNEMPMPFASDPENSMFPAYDWDKAENNEYCIGAYGETPQYNWALDFFGGRFPHRDFIKASNIVFSNGQFDPWQAGGVTFDVSKDTTPIYIEEGAHHLDLRGPNPADPPSIVLARKHETEHVAKWIDQYQGTNHFERVTAKHAALEAELTQ